MPKTRTQTAGLTRALLTCGLLTGPTGLRLLDGNENTLIEYPSTDGV